MTGHTTSRAAAADRSDAHLEQLRRRGKSLANRLRQAAIAADRSGLDITADLDQIEQHIVALTRRRESA